MVLGSRRTARWMRRGLAWSCAIAAGVLVSAAPRQATEPELLLGQSVDREIAGGAISRHRVMAAAGDFVHIRVEQRLTDVALSLTDPQGQVIAERDAPESNEDPEPLSFVASLTGAYIVSVRSLEPQKTTGRYSILLKDRRAATSEDRRRETAERALEAGHRAYKPETLTEAIARYQESFQLFRELALPEWEAHAAMKLAWVHLFREEVDQALGYVTQAVPLWESLGDAKRQAVALNVMAVIQLRKSDARAAIDPSRQALALAERASATTEQVSSLSNLSSAYWMLGDRQAEMSYQDRAIVLVRTLNDERQLASMLHNRGVSRQTVGESQDALVDLREALRIRTNLKDDRELANTLNAIAEIYREVDRLAEALDYHGRALTLRRASGDRAGIGQSLNNLGLVYRSLKDFPKAQASYEESLQLRRETKNRSGEATTLMNLAALFYSELKDYDKAQPLLTSAMALHEALGSVPGQASVLRHLARMHALQGDDTAALAEATRARDLGRQVRSQAVEVDSLKVLATLAARRGALDESRGHLEAAIGVVESGRRMLFGETLRTSFLATNADLYADYVDTLMRLHQRSPADGYDGRALQAAEQFRARSLLDLLQEARVNLSGEVAPDLVSQERALQQRIDVAARRPAVAGSPADAELNALLTAYRELAASVSASSPHLAALDPKPLSIRDIQTAVVDADTVLLEYSLGSARGYLWVITPTRAESFVLAGRDQIEPLARRAHELLTARNQHPAGETGEQWRARLTRSDAELPRVLTSLGHLVLDPASALIKGKRLLVVASGALQYVPFGALPSPGQTAPLIVTNEVVTLPSAATLLALRQQRVGRTRPSKLVAVLADPVFDAADSRLRANNASAVRPLPASTTLDGADSSWQWAASDARAVGEDGRLPRLRYSRDEAEAIAALTQPADRLVALDFQATRAEAMSERLRDFRIVHFASHGFVNSDHPELSGLALSMVDGRGQPIDGFLRLHQIYSLKLPADLVVLSACQTGLGVEVRGEGLMNLTRGFMFAGASAVAATLWKVDDQATAELMKQFYQAMFAKGRPATPAAALRTAQIAMWKQARWQSPYFWSAFVLQGDYR